MTATPTPLVTVSHLDSRPDLHELSQANVDEGAGHVLHRLFPSLKPAEFLDRYWNRDAYRETAALEDLSDLLPWTEVNRVLETHRAWPVRMQVAKGNKSLPPSSYLEPIPGRGIGREPTLRVSSTKLHQQLRDGATLVYGSIDEAVPAIRDLTERLEHDLRSDVFVNLYLAWGEVAAFAPHWDDHDGVIVQIAGSKEWELYGRGPCIPLPGEFRESGECEARPGDPVASFVLGPGEVLYIPRGYWHAARPIGGVTAHLTFGLRRPVVRDFLHWAVDRLVERRETRFDLPLSGWTQELAGWLETLLGGLNGLLTPDGVHQYLVEQDAQVVPRPRFALPYAVTGLASGCPLEASVRLAAPRPVPYRLAPAGCVVVAGNRRYELNGCWASTLACLLDGAVWPVAELCAVAADAGCPEGECPRLLAELVREGLLHMEIAGGASGS